MLEVGLTGGIGAGKSTVAKIIEGLGFPVYYADERGRYITSHDPLVLQGIKDNFGPGVFEGNVLNRSALGEIVFKDKKKLEILNKLIHPAVRQDYSAWLLEQKSDLVFSEIAILFEIGRFRDFAQTVLVTAPEALKIERVQKRNGWSEEAVKGRIANQWNDEQKAELANFTIVNDGNQELIPQVVKVVNELKAIVAKEAEKN
ncbi:MAG: dephospho-CoA kinase [Bacteroidota bacterium]